MEFIIAEDISDSSLTPTDTDIRGANDYLARMAYRCGITDLEALPPASAAVKRLGAVHACMTCALSLVGSDATVCFSDLNKREDLYSQKYKLYRGELATLEKSIAPYDFTGVATGGSTVSSTGIGRA